MFTTISENATAEIVEKKSKFIANMYYIENRKQAEEKIKELKKKYFDARHNCIAYRVIENNNILEKSSDDGEPSGTAGAPMLNILQKNNLCNVLVVVTRYFGGILLGTGGLVRCYSEATIQAIEKAHKIQICKGIEFEVKISYSEFENFKYYCRKNNINLSNMEYLDDVVCKLEMKEECKELFLRDIDKRNINIIAQRYIGEKLVKLYN
ncbi:MAG: YigZ family protein [Clostridia bacterium]|nr:YigZ family protein [Clostridia bacterium]